jgi:uroporphyrinogen III methyltransferase / synthase
MNIGTVYLVGAGPGDPGLLTIKGSDLIKTADCVLYDYLVSAEIVQLINPSAEKHFVGKRGGQKCITQAAINDLLVEKARQYAKVVRLKGGDPFIFGRGGEEALALVEAGVPFEIVPGVTAGIAAPAYAGIPVTFRGVSSSVAFITAHEDANKDETESHWKRIATNADTLVFYMGVARLPQLVDELFAQGRDGGTPVAVIRWGTTAEQEVYVGNLCNIVALISSHTVQPPALIVVGEVVKLRSHLQWFKQAGLATPPEK